jgi:hypothetical protein
MIENYSSRDAFEIQWHERPRYFGFPQAVEGSKMRPFLCILTFGEVYDQGEQKPQNDED